MDEDEVIYYLGDASCYRSGTRHRLDIILFL